MLTFFVSTTLLLMPVYTQQANAFLFKKFSIKDEVELGRKFSVLIKARLPIVEDPEVVIYMRSMLAKLMENIPAQPFDFEINVLRSNVMNAFAVPGGFVFVHTGMILNIEHEADLAGILAHEIAHITQRHIASRIEKAQVTQALSLVGAMAGIFLGGNTDLGTAIGIGSLAAGQSAMLNYSREDEQESDELGLQYLINAGYPPQGMVGGFEAIRKKQWITGRGVTEYLSTHPDVNRRLGYLNDRIRSFPMEIKTRPYDDYRFKRVQALIRARYTDADSALSYFKLHELPTDCLTLMGKGIALSRLNKVTEASDVFNKAMICAPLDALVTREAGRFHYEKGDLDFAGKLLQKAILLNRDDLMALFFYARLLGDKGELKQAYSYYQELLLHIPEDPQIHYFYGRLLGENNELFLAHLHMGYSAMYSNNSKKVEQHQRKFTPLARTDDEKRMVDLFEKRRKERAEFWDK